MPTCRVIIDEPASGAWNMALDEALLLSVGQQSAPPTLRLYQWKEATLSLGYFQAYTDRASHLPSSQLPCVRRSSGGGALVHDRELTYSLTLPIELVAGRESGWLYCQAHHAIIESFEELGATTSVMRLCSPEGTAQPAADPFLCFQRRADGDLLVEDPRSGVIAQPGPDGRYKVGGSAQRKRYGALLQHGGVLLGRSDAAPELPGTQDLLVSDTSADELAEVLARKLLLRIGLDQQSESVTEVEHASAKNLVAEKHGCKSWIQRR